MFEVFFAKHTSMLGAYYSYFLHKKIKEDKVRKNVLKVKYKRFRTKIL